MQGRGRAAGDVAAGSGHLRPSGDHRRDLGPRRTHPQAEGAPGRSRATVAMEDRKRAPAAFYLEGEHSGDEEARESGQDNSRG